MDNKKQYLGDGVYVSFNGFHIILSTSDGYSDTNTIYLEDSVYNALVRYVQSLSIPDSEDNN